MPKPGNRPGAQPPEVGQALGKDHGPCRAARIDRTAVPGSLGGGPGAGAVHRLVEIQRVAAGKVDQVGGLQDLLILAVVRRGAVDDLKRVDLCAERFEMLLSHPEPAAHALIAFLAGGGRKAGNLRCAAIGVHGCQQVTIHFIHDRQVFTGTEQSDQTFHSITDPPEVGFNVSIRQATCAAAPLTTVPMHF